MIADRILTPEERAELVVAAIEAAGLSEDANAWRQNIAAVIRMAEAEQRTRAAQIADIHAATYESCEGITAIAGVAVARAIAAAIRGAGARRP